VRRAATPRRVPIGQVLTPQQVVRLSTERKPITDVIKIAAYRAESLLLRWLRPYFPRADDEGSGLPAGCPATARRLGGQG
jgi:hypothetical protein